MSGQPHKQPVHRFLPCAKCNETRPPEGGVQLRADKWVCAKCWARAAATSHNGSKK